MGHRCRRGLTAAALGNWPAQRATPPGHADSSGRRPGPALAVKGTGDVWWPGRGSRATCHQRRTRAAPDPAARHLAGAPAARDDRRGCPARSGMPPARPSPSGQAEGVRYAGGLGVLPTGRLDVRWVMRSHGWMVPVLAAAAALFTGPAAAIAATTSADSISGLEYAATSAQGRFAGIASGALPGAWSVTVDHTPLVTAAAITGGDFHLATRLDGTLTVLTGDFTRGRSGSCPASADAHQRYAVTGVLGGVGPGSAGRGTGTFAATLTHYLTEIFGQCVTYSASVSGSLSLASPDDPPLVIQSRRRGRRHCPLRAGDTEHQIDVTPGMPRRCGMRRRGRRARHDGRCPASRGGRRTPAGGADGTKVRERQGAGHRGETPADGCSLNRRPSSTPPPDSKVREIPAGPAMPFSSCHVRA